ncbi:MAG: FAD-dependent 5-carboxymethylaminomethyl-2-thiouridine(34) oxidoreductase MnmC [Paralcaligenes sp.]
MGHNFLALWQAWRADPQRSQRLHMVSFEAHPFSRGDLMQVLLPRLPATFLPLARALLAAWPPLLPGLHRLEFESANVTLTLAFGRVEKLARQIDAQVDAYFLDGFAPQKNPEMWSPRLFGQLVRMARPGATAASWCCAGSMRRALGEAGFLVSKAPGFGPKREMTVATLRSGVRRDAVAVRPDQSVMVVGGGLAGAGIAHCLALRGYGVTVFDPAFDRGLDASHKGHRAAALSPLVSRDDDIRARLSRAGIFRALQRWQTFPEEARPVRCGTLDLAADADEESERQITLATLSFPKSWVAWMDAAEASRLLGFASATGGIFFSDGQWVRPEPLLRAMLETPGVTCRAARVGSLEFAEPGWRLRDVCGQELARASTVVVANALAAKDLLAITPYAAHLPALASVQALAGQVSYFALPPSLRRDLILAAQGYCLPAVDGVSVAGGTYVADAVRSEVTYEGHEAVIGKLSEMLRVPAADVRYWLHESQGWAGWRAVATGRLPLIGSVAQAPGLWLACAYGSRGLTWSALAGDVIAAKLSGEPAPVERDLLRAMAPR